MGKQQTPLLLRPSPKVTPSLYDDDEEEKENLAKKSVAKSQNRMALNRVPRGPPVSRKQEVYVIYGVICYGLTSHSVLFQIDSVKRCLVSKFWPAADITMLWVTRGLWYAKSIPDMSTLTYLTSLQLVCIRGGFELAAFRS